MSEKKPANKKAKKSSKKPAKKRVSARIKRMALKYEAAWKKVYSETDNWKRAIVEEEPSGRHAKELYHAAVVLAESEGFEPRKAKYAGEAEDSDVIPSMITGKHPE